MIAWSTAPLLDESGNVRNIICGGLDVTERKRHEIELDRERDFLSKVGDITPSLLVVVDDEAKVVEDAVNESFRKTMGWGDARDARPQLRRALPRGRPLLRRDRGRVGVQRRRPAAPPVALGHARGGDIRVVEWTATPIVDILGREHVLVCGVDVTERERREYDLRSSEERLRATIEASPVAVLEVDLDDRISLWNPAAERMFGWTAEEMVGGPLRHIPDEERERLGELMTRVRAGEVYTGVESEAALQGRTPDRRRDLGGADPRRLRHRDQPPRAVRGHQRPQAAGGGAPRLARPDRQGRRRGEAAARAESARRRAAAARRALTLAAPRPDEGRAATRRRPRWCSSPHARSSPPLSTSCASSRAASIRPSSPTGASPRRSRRSPRACRSPSRSRRPTVELPQAVEAAAYYVIAEALANVIKYARASVVDRSRQLRRDERPCRGRRRRRRRRRCGRRLGPARPRPTASPRSRGR